MNTWFAATVFAVAVVDTFAEAATIFGAFATELETASSLFEANTGIPADASRLPDTLDQNKLLSKQCINDLMQGFHEQRFSTSHRAWGRRSGSKRSHRWSSGDRDSTLE